MYEIVTCVWDITRLVSLASSAKFCHRIRARELLRPKRQFGWFNLPIGKGEHFSHTSKIHAYEWTNAEAYKNYRRTCYDFFGMTIRARIENTSGHFQGLYACVRRFYNREITLERRASINLQNTYNTVLLFNTSSRR